MNLADDAEGSVVLRNFSIDRNYAEGADHDEAKEWTQSLILNFNSGHTGGEAGLGFDVLGLYSFKLDGGRGTTGTQLLPTHNNGRPAKSFGRLAPSMNYKWGAGHFKIGEFIPELPILLAADGRSLPQTFQGWQLDTLSFNSLRIYSGQFYRNSPRDEAAMSKMGLAGKSDRNADRFDYVGATYDFRQGRSKLSLWKATLQNTYEQLYVELKSQHTFYSNILRIKSGFFQGKETGNEKEGKLDNRTVSTLVSIEHGPNTIYLGYQQVNGKNSWLRVNGTSGGTLANDSFAGSFDNANELSWQIRYDYNFTEAGIPGLLISSRYVEGRNVVNDHTHSGHEFTKELELSYTLQYPPLKKLNFAWRHISARRNWDKNNTYEENRLTLSYPIKLF